MKISKILAKALTPDLKEKWSLLQESDPAFASPFFCPEFTSSLALYRNDIYVASMEENGDVVGIFPFRLGKYSIAKPIYMCDYQGVVVKKGIAWKIEDVLRSCSLVAWDFSQLIAPQVTLQKTDYLKMISYPIINLSKGYEAYLAGLRKYRAEGLDKTFGRILHWWFPACNKKFEKYSPGSVLLLKMAEVFSSVGIELIDFGAGGEAYKRQLSSDSIPIGQGTFEVPSLVTSVRKFCRDMKTSVRTIPYLYIPLRKAVRFARKISR